MCKIRDVTMVVLCCILRIFKETVIDLCVVENLEFQMLSGETKSCIKKSLHPLRKRTMGLTH